MAISTAEARERILTELGLATEQLALAVACLGEAFEQLAVDSADRLEDELFRPVQRAYARARRGRAEFAARVGLDAPASNEPSPGRAGQGAKAFVERAAEAAGTADHVIAELQDSMLPIEAGDAELRSTLGAVRELLAPVPARARGFLGTLGR